MSTDTGALPQVGHQLIADPTPIPQPASPPVLTLCEGFWVAPPVERERRLVAARRLVSRMAAVCELRRRVAGRILDLRRRAEWDSPESLWRIGREFRRAGLAGQMRRRALALKARGETHFIGHPDAMECAALRLILARRGDREQAVARIAALLSVWQPDGLAAENAPAVDALLSDYLRRWCRVVADHAMARRFWREANRAGFGLEDVRAVLAEPEFAGGDYRQPRAWLGLAFLFDRSDEMPLHAATDATTARNWAGAELTEPTSPELPSIDPSLVDVPPSIVPQSCSPVNSGRATDACDRAPEQTETAARPRKSRGRPPLSPVLPEQGLAAVFAIRSEGRAATITGVARRLGIGRQRLHEPGFEMVLKAIRMSKSVPCQGGDLPSGFQTADGGVEAIDPRGCPENRRVSV